MGEGIAATGSISERAIDRAIAALSICSDKIRYRKAKRLRLIANRSLPARDMPRAFGPGWPAKPGSGLEVIDRETEATLAVIGCSPLLVQGARCHPVDIRGGSTELVRLERVQRRYAPPRSRHWMSIRSASSRWPSISAARDVTAEAYAAHGGEVAQYVAPFRAPGTPATCRHAHAGHSGTVHDGWLASPSQPDASTTAGGIDGVWMNNSK